MAIALLVALGLLPAAASLAQAPVGAPGFELSVDRIERPGVPTVRDLRIACPTHTASGVLLCDRGRFSAEVEGIGALAGPLTFSTAGDGAWRAAAGPAAFGGGRITLELAGGKTLTVKLEADGLRFDALQRIAQRFGHAAPLSGKGSVAVRAVLRQIPQGWDGTFEARLRGASVSDASGRYATDGLDADLSGAARVGRGGTAAVTVRLSRGQAYAEPVFEDFGAAPLALRADLSWPPDFSRLRLSRIGLDQARVLDGRGDAEVLLHPAFAVHDARIALDLKDLARIVAIYAQPFLAGSRLADAGAAGSGTVSVNLAFGAPVALDLALRDASVATPKLGLALAGVNGELHWAAQEAPVSRLSWRGGTVKGAPLVGASSIAFRAAGRDFALAEPLRVPVLNGALEVRRLSLTALGQPQMTAGFDGLLTPVDLAALSKLFGWPEFGGTLSGRLPGLRLEQGQLSLDGGLEAEAFGGKVTVGNLRVIEPWSPAPRIAADLHLRRLDLAQLTGVFSFGRIEGRLDGDVEGLRLLGFKPVAFDARLYTTPGDDSRHRISQRAIDNISALGGGPTGMLSRGFMSFFKSFVYDRIGWRCRLANGVCRMGGLGPAPNGGYYLVSGKFLPRIDVVGYSRDVSWDDLLERLARVTQGGAAQVK